MVRAFSDRILVKTDRRMPSVIPDKQTQIEKLDDVSSRGTLQDSPPVQSSANSVSETSILSEDSWLINWSIVEVPQSPNLSRLFMALKIECENPVPALSLEPGYLPDVPRCISERQIQDLFNNDNKTVLNSDGNNQLYSSEKYEPPPPFPLVPTGQKSPIADIQDFATAIFFGYSASPLNELYIFSGSPLGGPTETNFLTGLLGLSGGHSPHKRQTSKRISQNFNHSSASATRQLLRQRRIFLKPTTTAGSTPKLRC
jgi:hypothetical protein